jgi:hypothetical protein
MDSFKSYASILALLLLITSINNSVVSCENKPTTKSKLSTLELILKSSTRVNFNLKYIKNNQEPLPTFSTQTRQTQLAKTTEQIITSDNYVFII